VLRQVDAKPQSGTARADGRGADREGGGVTAGETPQRPGTAQTARVACQRVRRAHGGEGGIRTHGTGLPYTCFPSKRLRPLGHLSEGAQRSPKSDADPSPAEADAAAEGLVKYARPRRSPRDDPA